MGFIKWLYAQYQTYQIEKNLPKKDDNEFLSIFRTFIDMGYTESEFLAIANLISCMTRK